VQNSKPNLFGKLDVLQMATPLTNTWYVECVDCRM